MAQKPINVSQQKFNIIFNGKLISMIDITYKIYINCFFV